MGWSKISKFGVAILPYTPSVVITATAARTPESCCVPLRIGDQVQIFHQCDGWYHGEVVDTHNIGIFPISCVKIKGKEGLRSVVMVRNRRFVTQSSNISVARLGSYVERILPRTLFNMFMLNSRKKNTTNSIRQRSLSTVFYSSGASWLPRPMRQSTRLLKAKSTINSGMVDC